jgi:hypothetical protein
LLLICNALNVETVSVVGVKVSSFTGDFGDGIDGADEGGDGRYEHSGSEIGTHEAWSATRRVEEGEKRMQEYY